MPLSINKHTTKFPNGINREKNALYQGILPSLSPGKCLLPSRCL